MKNKKCAIVSAVFVVALIVLELVPITYSSDKVLDGMIDIIVTRLIGFLAFLPLANRHLFGLVKEGRVRKLLCCLVPFAVVINNFPFVGLISGNASLTSPIHFVAIFAVQSLSISLFEEFAFRGAIFPVILEKRRGSTKEIFWATVISSALFGGIHLLNLFAGGSPVGVLLQIGYSFLIGGMCSIVLLHTHCIWICVALHAIFDFGGLFISTLGQGRIWDPLTVAVTTVLGVCALVFMLLWLAKIKPSDLDVVFESSKND